MTDLDYVTISQASRHYPMDVHRLRTKHGQLTYRALGDASSRTVVLVHGVAAGGRQFFADAKYFAEIGFRVLVPDLPGHDESSIVDKKDGASLTKEAMADAMLGMLEHAGASGVHWVGNSLGGIVGLEMLSRTGHGIRSFATFGTVYSMALPRLAENGFHAAYNVLGRNLLGKSTAFVTTNDLEARMLIEQMISSFDPDVGAAVARSVRNYDYRQTARAFDGPVLLIEGARDIAVNMGIGATKKAMIDHPRFRHERFDKGGHCLNLDEPQRFRTTLVDFWKKAEDIHTTL